MNFFRSFFLFPIPFRIRPLSAPLSERAFLLKASKILLRRRSARKKHLLLRQTCKKNSPPTHKKGVETHFRRLFQRGLKNVSPSFPLRQNGALQSARAPPPQRGDPLAAAARRGSLGAGGARAGRCCDGGSRCVCLFLHATHPINLARSLPPNAAPRQRLPQHGRVLDSAPDAHRCHWALLNLHTHNKQRLLLLCPSSPRRRRRRRNPLASSSLRKPVKFVPLTEGSGTFVDDLSGEVAGKINTTTAR